MTSSNRIPYVVCVVLWSQRAVRDTALHCSDGHRNGRRREILCSASSFMRICAHTIMVGQAVRKVAVHLPNRQSLHHLIIGVRTSEFRRLICSNPAHGIPSISVSCVIIVCMIERCSIRPRISLFPACNWPHFVLSAMRLNF